MLCTTTVTPVTGEPQKFRGLWPGSAPFSGHTRGHFKSR